MAGTSWRSWRLGRRRKAGRPRPRTKGNLYDSSLGYALNYYSSCWYYPHSLGQVNKPSETCWFVDNHYYLFYTGYLLALDPTNIYYGVNGSYTLRGRHNDGHNVGHYDGHAKWYSLQSIHGHTTLDAFNYWAGN